MLMDNSGDAYVRVNSMPSIYVCLRGFTREKVRLSFLIIFKILKQTMEEKHWISANLVADTGVIGLYNLLPGFFMDLYSPEKMQIKIIRKECA